ncbi:hypothetical protein, partial [Duodenibacillus massiliensis]|uniref:hypothetical protein n=1 Tax=Duodenibacillus massiliensis TaxID=1852381 RepID=UPI003A934A25
DFIAAEYTLSENYVHGLAAFGPRLKKFRKPAFLPGLKPRASCGKFCENRGARKAAARLAKLLRMVTVRLPEERLCQEHFSTGAAGAVF